MTSYGGASSLSGAPAFLVYRMPRNGAISAITPAYLGVRGEHLVAHLLAPSLSFCASALSDSARIAAASSAAFSAPSTATVATGMPGGICTVDSSESNPLSVPAAIGTPITGRVVCAATAPARCAAAPAPQMNALTPRRTASLTKTRPSLRACGAPTARAPPTARPSFVSASLAVVHRLEIRLRSHHHARRSSGRSCSCSSCPMSRRKCMPSKWMLSIARVGARARFGPIARRRR